MSYRWKNDSVLRFKCSQSRNSIMLVVDRWPQEKDWGWMVYSGVEGGPNEEVAAGRAKTKQAAIRRANKEAGAYLRAWAPRA